MIYVIATVTIAPGKRDAFLREFKAVVPLVLKEQGCQFYCPTLDLPTGLAKQIPVRDEVVVIVEGWDSLEDLRAHLVAPHMADYRQKVQDLVVKSELQVLHEA